MLDLRRSLRRIRRYRFTHPLRRRPREELPFVPASPESGRELLLDTCVYIDVLHGNTPPEVDKLPRLRTVNHLAVRVAELTHGFGRLDPRQPGAEAMTRAIAQVVEAIPPHRLEAAGMDVVIEAGILAGLVFRLYGLQPGQEIAALNDAILYLYALPNGRTVLMRHVRDFDAMNQIVPDGGVLFYDRID